MAKIVVGYDESSRGRAALRWATQEALWRNAILCACHIWDAPSASCDEAAERAAGRLASLRLAEGALLAQQLLPVDRVESLLIHGSVGPELVGISRDTELVVLGIRGHNGSARLRLGSATHYVVPRAGTSVAVVQDSELPTVHDDRGASVVLAVDSTALDSAALRTAFAEARWRNADLYAWCGSWVDPSFDANRQWFEGIVPAWQAEFPDVTVKPAFVHDQPLPQLISPLDDVELVVLGTPDGSSALTLLNQTLVSQPMCPIIITKNG
jgi:nucleotide-binding universal stress UspA family protein